MSFAKNLSPRFFKTCMSWSDDNTAKIVRILASLKEERNRREVPLSLTSITKPTKHTFMHNKQ